MPARAIIPKPYQKPHPPMWVAVTSPGTELDAADRGMGSLGLTFAPFAEQEQRIAEYRRRIQLCKPVGEFVNDQLSTVNFLYCHEDDAMGAPPAAAWPTRSSIWPASSTWPRRPTPRALPVAAACSPRLAPPGHGPGGQRAGRRGHRHRQARAHHARS